MADLSKLALELDAAADQPERYRQAVCDFLSRALGDAYDIEQGTELRVDRKRPFPFNKEKIVRERVYTVSADAEKLLNDVMSRQADGIRRLERTGRADALLVDLRI